MDNYVWIRGEVIESVEFSHEIAGKKYWRTKISCERRSGRKDILPVILRKKADISVGDFVEVKGVFRSTFNRKAEPGWKRHILAYSIVLADKEDPGNFVKLEGTVTKEPVFRTTPNGHEITDLYVIAKLVAYTDKKETASNKKTLKEEKESKYFQKVYEKWTKKLDKKWSYEKNVDQKLWKQVKLNDADDSSEATTKVKKQTKNETTEKQKTN